MNAVWGPFGSTETSPGGKCSAPSCWDFQCQRTKIGQGTKRLRECSERSDVKTQAPSDHESHAFRNICGNWPVGTLHRRIKLGHNCSRLCETEDQGKGQAGLSWRVSHAWCIQDILLAKISALIFPFQMEKSTILHKNSICVCVIVRVLSFSVKTEPFDKFRFYAS